MSNEPQDSESGGPGKRFYVVLAALAAAGLAALLLVGGSGTPEPLGPLSQSSLQVEPDPGAYAVARGPEDAPVTVMEFVDFTCSHCATFASLPGPALQRDYVQTGKARMLIYDFPLSQQGNSVPAALAARCAGEQGRYGEMESELFSNQSTWVRDQSPEDRFADYARQLGLDMGQFNSCYSNREYVAEIMASRRYGDQLNVRGTPTIFVNGQRSPGMSYEAVASLIERELAEADTTASASAGGGGSSR